MNSLKDSSIWHFQEFVTSEVSTLTHSMAVKEQLIFPEIEYDKIDAVRGMDIIMVTTANTDEEGRELLKLLGAPFSE